jgi:mRNA-degrading endonuclease RelE of RelBE toxin-antitoxin system
MTFKSLPEFDKDLKRLLKKYRSIHSDVDVVKKVLHIRPDEKPPFSFRINDLGVSTCVIKIRKIACDSLKGKGVNSGLRLIYAYFAEEQMIIFIELYHKSDKQNEDRQRILSNFK